MQKNLRKRRVSSVQTSDGGTDDARLGWPGLAKEVVDICEKLEIPNVLAQNIPKSKVKQAIYNHHNNEIKYEK